MTGYGQFCPVAKSMELLDERWTILVVRELLCGSHHFNELRRGVPRMSPALLSKRLRSLVRGGIVVRREEGNRVRYDLTRGGQELAPFVMALGEWGMRWRSQLGDDDLDPHLLMWDLHRNLDLAAMPSGRVVLGFRFTDVDRSTQGWFVVVEDNERVDLCDFDPGYEVLVTVTGGLRALTEVWRGDVAWREATRSGRVSVEGQRQACRDLPAWLRLSSFARVPGPRHGSPAEEPTAV